MSTLIKKPLGTNSLLTVLKNNIKVVSSNLPCHFAGIGAYLNAGSRHEQPPLMGMSYMLSRMAFKSTKNFSKQQMEQKLLALGGNYQCEPGRENMIYQASTFTHDIDTMAQLIASTITEPVFNIDEVNEQRKLSEYELESLDLNADLKLPELAHRAAFKTQLGNPLFINKDNLSLVTQAALWQYQYAFYSPDRLTLSFVGVGHEKAVEISEKYFGEFKNDTKLDLSSSRSEYQGGDICVPLPPPVGGAPEFYHCQILFRGRGVNHRDAYSLAVLQVLLGGGGSFSAGGPGKGMYSRLYTQVLNQYPYIESCIAVNHQYSDDGLFGITCSSLPEAAQYLPYIICSQLTLLAQPGKLTVKEVERAKNQLRSQLLMNLESRVVQMEDTGRQVCLTGGKLDITDVLKRIDEIDPENLQQVAYELLTSSKPTIVLMGEREKFGNVRGVVNEFGLGSK